MKTRLIYLSLLLLSMPLFAQKIPEDIIAKDTKNWKTENLKGKVKSIRSLVYDKNGKVEGLQIDKYDKNGNQIQSSYQLWPLSANGGCLSYLRLSDYDEEGRLTGVFWSSRSCGGDTWSDGDYYTVKYDSKGRPIDITYYDMGEYQYATDMTNGDLNVIKPKEAFQDMDSKTVTGHESYLYDEHGKLLVIQSTPSDERHVFEYDKYGRLKLISYYWYSSSDEQQYVNRTYYLNKGGKTVSVGTSDHLGVCGKLPGYAVNCKASDNIVHELNYYDSIFYQEKSPRKLQEATIISYDFREYNKKCNMIVVKPNNLSDALSIAESVIDTSMAIEYYKEVMKYDREGHCIKEITTNRWILSDNRSWREEEEETNYDFNSHGDKTKKEGYFKNSSYENNLYDNYKGYSGVSYCENYLYDNHGNWTRYDQCANSSHDFQYSYERTIKYYDE